MRIATYSALAAVIVFVLSAVDLNGNKILGITIDTVEAGPLSKRLESKHKPAPHAQANMQGGDAEAREQCIEMLHKGDHEGAQKCIAQLPSGDSGGTQTATSQAQPAVQPSQPADAPSPAPVPASASGAQGELSEAREKCAEMLRSGDRAGARDCIRKLKK